MADQLHIDGRTYIPMASALQLSGMSEPQIRSAAVNGSVRLRAAGKKIYVELDSLRTLAAAPVVRMQAPAVFADSAPSIPTRVPTPTREIAPTVPPRASVPPTVSPFVVPPARPMAYLRPAIQPQLPVRTKSIAGMVAGILAIVCGGGAAALAYTHGPMLATIIANVGTTLGGHFGVAPASQNAAAAGAVNGSSYISNGYSPSEVQTATIVASQASTSSTPAARPIYYVYNYPVIERVIQEAPAISATNSADFSAQLQELYNKIETQIQSMGVNTGTQLAQTYQVIAQTNRIDKLDNVVLTNPTIKGGSISGITFSAGDISGVFGVGSGGTGTSTAPSYGQLLVGDGSGGYSFIATSSFGGGTSLIGTQGQVPYFSGTNTAVGTSSVFITPTGLVGIGTTTPNALLTVTNGNLFVNSTTQDSGVYISGIPGHFGSIHAANAANTVAEDLVLQNSGGNVGIATTSPGSIFSVNDIINFTTATSTLYSTGGINLTGGGCFAVNGTCISSSAGASLSGTNTWTALNLFSAGASTTNFSVFGTAYFGGSATSSFNNAGQLTLAGLTNSVLSVNASGQIVATSSIGTNLLTGSLGTVNGSPFSTGSSITVSAASSTLLANNNTWTGLNTFNGASVFGSATSTNLFSVIASSTNLFSQVASLGSLTVGSTITGSISGNAGTATALQTPRNINGVSFNGSADITVFAASSTLLANNNTFSGVNSFTGNTTFGNATTTNFFAQNASTTNATSTSLFAVLGHFTTGVIDTLSSTVSTITGLTATNLTATNATTTGNAYFGARVGIGTTSPYRTLSVADQSSNSQLALSYDGSRAAEIRVDASGNLNIEPSGANAFLNNDNLWVCTGGSISVNGCPSGTPTGLGNIIAENKIGVGTTTPSAKFVVETQDNTTNLLQLASSTAQNIFVVNANGNVGIGTSTPSAQLATAGMIFVGANNVTTMGIATSTFYGDIKIAGKLDVGTIDPVYTIDGTKYATYGSSQVGVKEEVSFKATPSQWDASKKMYAYTIDFNKLEKGSDVWLFYQVTDFGADWNNLIVSLTPAFSGTVYYEQSPKDKTLTIYSSAQGPVSVRLLANRFDFSKWPNLRPDQTDMQYKGFEIQSKSTTTL